MSTKIGGFNNVPVRESSGHLPVKANNTATGNVQPEKPTNSTSDTQITESARQLAALEHSIKHMPAIDEARVEQIRARLEEGTYKIDPQRIADKLAQFERALDGSESH